MAEKDLAVSNWSKNRRLYMDYEDRLSALPDALLLNILSLIPFKTAVRTCVLSHKWHDLWTQLPKLIFKCGHQSLHEYFSTAAHILNKLSSTHLETVHLHSTYRVALGSDEVRMCFEFFDSIIPLICARNPVNVKICSKFRGESTDFVPFPACIFESHSMVQLELVGKFFCRSGAICLPKLKKLVLKGTHLDQPLLGALVKSCPLLETLSLSLHLMEGGVFDVSSGSLKSLTISMDKPSPRAKFIIDAPMLETIEMHTYPASYCFVKPPSELNKAYISFDESVFRGRKYKAQIEELLRGISSVKSIDLVNNIAIFRTIKKNANVWSIFHNLTHLSLNVASEFVDYVGSESSIPPCFLSRLKMIELKFKQGLYYDSDCEVVDTDSDIKLVKHILRKSIALEELHVFCLPDDNDFDDNIDDEDFDELQLSKEYQHCRKLFTLERSSSICKITYHGAFINASSDSYEKGLFTDTAWPWTHPQSLPRLQPRHHRRCNNSDDDDDDGYDDARGGEDDDYFIDD